MATKTFEELKQMAIQIRDEKTNKQNTATRIGTQMLEHLNKLEQEYYNKENIDEQKEQTDAKFSELIFGKVYATAKQGEDNFYEVELLKGTVDIELQAPLYNSYAKLVLYNEEGDIISNPTGESVYIAKGESKKYTLQILEDIKKVELRCTTGQIDAVIISNNSLYNLRKDFEVYRIYQEGHI
ncbi:hypothetical protein, partial [Bacteroides caecigallinarum]|uniref:hypothetical protein n=1 Tax=Bacteroides caecigallinarum TaxID=1411144 RepID=UPI001F19F2BC